MGLYQRKVKCLWTCVVQTRVVQGATVLLEDLPFHQCLGGWLFTPSSFSDRGCLFHDIRLATSILHVPIPS